MSEALRAFSSFSNDVKSAHNYACQSWQLSLDEYKRADHPSAQDQLDLVARAKECLVLLESVAQSEADQNWAQALFVYQNCHQIERSVRNTRFYEPDKDDPNKWRSHALPSSVKLTLPGQETGWDEQVKHYRACIREAYDSTHHEEQAQVNELKDSIARVEAQLAALKNEKRAQGFFNFAGKRKVKERMAPVKQQLKQLRADLKTYDRAFDSFLEAQLKEIGKTFIRLSY